MNDVGKRRRKLKREILVFIYNLDKVGKVYAYGTGVGRRPVGVSMENSIICLIGSNTGVKASMRGGCSSVSMKAVLQQIPSKKSPKK